MVQSEFVDVNKLVDIEAKVRQTIKKLGDIMPEDLDTSTKSIQQIKKERQKKLSK